MAKRKKSVFKKWWFWVLAIVVVIAVASPGEEDAVTETKAEESEQGSIEENQETSDEPSDDTEVETSSNEETDEGKGEDANEEVSEDEVIEEQEPAVETFSEGMYEVGTEIEPGIYFNPDGSIYVERLSGFSGEFDDIIANANPNGPYYIEIKPSDKGVSFGNGGWRALDEEEKSRHEMKKSFSSGIYLVGVDIEPGKYKLEGNGVYWARLSGVSLDFDTIIANGNPTGGSAIVEVSPNDFAFEVSGGTWTKVE